MAVDIGYYSIYALRYNILSFIKFKNFIKLYQWSIERAINVIFFNIKYRLNAQYLSLSVKNKNYYNKNNWHIYIYISFNSINS